jgi:hypothetical protein
VVIAATRFVRISLAYLNDPHREGDAGSPQVVDQVRSLKWS